LALSGGGFRAAFFHLGVLARLAETGILRQVEVISCVSGGSIIGALYYLHVKDLLENVDEGSVEDRHYVEIVARIEKDFFAGVARQVRARAYANLGKNFRMARADYSRSDRMGELYDETFYRLAWEHPSHGSTRRRESGRTLIEMRELLVTPHGRKDGYKPLQDNEQRKTPVPILLLNATSLNTGHSWRFEAVGMGEDPRLRDAWAQIDKNMRLRTARYEEIAPQHADFKLGIAVAASACVPALFQPLAVSGLFKIPDGSPTDVRVQLVDGGVHDNQGVCGLIDTNCRRMIVSDASGPMLDENEPSTHIPAVGGRASSIQGDRVREEEMIGVWKTPPVAVMHLRKGLPAEVFSPLGASGQPIEPTDNLGTIGYGVDDGVKDRLSRVRTDLDSFTEVEAWSLARYGYVMTTAEIAGVAGIQELARGDPLSNAWLFDADPRLAQRMATPTATYLKHLKVAKSRFFKLFWLDRAALVGAAVVALLLLGLVGWGIYAGRGAFAHKIPVWVAIAAAAGGLVLAALYMTRAPVRAVRALADVVFTVVFPILLAPILFVASWIMLLLNPLFLRAGRLERAVRP
jgi:predicted acylesterase/phospholipase RssA